MTNLGQLQLDALKEISSIGAGNASTALSQFLNKKVEMAPPGISILTAHDAPIPIPSTVPVMAMVALEAIAEVSGYIVVVFELKNALFLIDSLMGKSPGSTTQQSLSEIEISAFKEVASVMAASFLRVTGDMIGITLRMSTPYFSIGTHAEIRDFIVSHSLKDTSSTLCLNSELYIIDVTKLQGFLLFIPFADSVSILLKLLGVG